MAAAISRRCFLAGAAVLAAGFEGGSAAFAQDAVEAARRLLAGALTIDMHSHAGGFVREESPASAVAEPMRTGGIAVACLAVVADSGTHQVMADGRIHPTREPAAGELYASTRGAFGRLLRVTQREGLHIVGSTADLRAAPTRGPSAIIASEGADFLEGRLERLDEARINFGLRHLQLVHYRHNELGDMQTEAPVRGGLTDFGAEVIRACNRLGVVVDVAHGSYELVRRAATVTTRPLVLSHTSLTAAPRVHSRQISSDHARIVAGTGGVIGVWPPQSIYPTIEAMTDGFRRMVDAVGIDHVGLGTDMRGLVGGTLLPTYREVPLLAQALLARGFGATEVGKLFGSNYARVFAATVG